MGEEPDGLERVFAECPTAPVVPDAFALAAVSLALAAVVAALGASWAAGALAGLAGFVIFFFRNPARVPAGDAGSVLAPADGRVVELGEVEDETGRKRVRIGIFLSLFDVHVNRSPVSGRVVAIERHHGGHRAAFRRAASENARVAMWLETAHGARVQVVQIAGWLARRIVCHPRVGEWVPRGARYGLIRFGSRTDVVLPFGAEACVARGQHVRGGATVIAGLGAAS